MRHGTPIAQGVTIRGVAELRSNAQSAALTSLAAASADHTRKVRAVIRDDYGELPSLIEAYKTLALGVVPPTVIVGAIVRAIARHGPAALGIHGEDDYPDELLELIKSIVFRMREARAAAQHEGLRALEATKVIRVVDVIEVDEGGNIIDIIEIVDRGEASETSHEEGEHHDDMDGGDDGTDGDAEDEEEFQRLHVRVGRKVPRADVEGDAKTALRFLAALKKGKFSEEFEKLRTLAGGIMYFGPFDFKVLDCDTTPIVTKSGREVDEISLRFTTTRSVADLKRYADPRYWIECSSFFVGMDCLSVTPSFEGNDWVATFEESVELLPFLTLSQPLAFKYHAEEQYVRSDYWLMAPTADLCVDEGYIEIKPAPKAKPDDSERTLVTVTKAVEFAEATILDVWPDYPCATFWGELAIDMASACS
jgi:hypothetical protein